MRLHVVHDCPAADSLECDAVQLVVRAELDAGKLDPNVLKRAAVVVRVVAAVDAGVALACGLAAAEVQGRAAVDDDAAPVASPSLPDRLIAREDDRRRRCSDGVQPPSALDDQRPDAAGLADDPRTSRDVERGARPDEDRAAQDVVVRVDPGFIPASLTGDHDDGLVDARDIDGRGLIRGQPGGWCNGET